jgi:hypothetical protein
MSKKPVVVIFQAVVLITLVSLVTYLLVSYFQTSSRTIRFKSEIPQTRLVANSRESVDKYLSDLNFWKNDVYIKPVNDDRIQERPVKPASLTVVVREGQGRLDTFVVGPDDRRSYRSISWEVSEKGNVTLYIFIDSGLISELKIDRDFVISLGFVRGAYFISRKGIASDENLNELNTLSESFMSAQQPLLKLTAGKTGLLERIKNLLIKPVSAACGGPFVECGTS